jgi:glycosyltransferase involved in cell wall biosynthesis
MKTLAGILCIRNGLKLDYCFREAGQSLLGVCDEVVICDSDSDDGTRQIMG